jgi:hypothetical protein
MEDTRTSVEEFIRHFERNNNKSDFSDAVSQFADAFMAAGPEGAQWVRASDFALALPKRKQLFASFGCDGMNLVRVDARSLGNRYAMAHTRWKINFTEDAPSSPAVFVDSTFVLDKAEGGFRVVLYLAHQDVMAMLKERAALKS